jgi:hypothetical protein
MAQTIPTALLSGVSRGEDRLFQILKRLPDDVIVYHEPLVGSRHPDFVIILPTLGILLIEVKGWYLSNIVAADSKEVRIREDEKEDIRAHPLRQVRDYKFRLLDECAKDKQFSKLVHLSGPYEGKLSFPVGSFALLSNINRSQLATFPRSDEIFSPSSVATRDQLLAWEKLSPEELLEVFKAYFDPFWPIPRLSQNQVNIVKAIIHPECLLALDFTTSRPSEPTVKVLDAQQESLARKIDSGHRLVFGVAGSGKTVVLIARAKLLARLNSSARILVLCYNVTFSAYLAEMLKGYPTITVLNFHAWAATNGATWDSNDDSHLGQGLLELLRSEKHPAPDARRYDSVLIDEGQDFESDWFGCALAAMKEPKNGDLLIVGDANQGMYRRTKISWKQLGIEAQGRTQYLALHYRNTRPILRLASLFSAKAGADDEDGLGQVWSDPESSARIHGPDPRLVLRPNKKEEVEHAADIVADLLRGLWFGEKIEPVRPQDIGIVYPRLRSDDRKLIKNLCGLLEKDDCPAIWLSESSAARRRIGEPGVKIVTAHAAKGLQFKAVLFLFANECPARFADTSEADERRLYYVALTRAEDFLAVSHSGDSKFIDEIKAAVPQ